MSPDSHQGFANSMENRCERCGAVLPSDIEFQNYHMLKVHNLEV